MFTHLMRESRIYGHNKAHLETCTKCQNFKKEFEKIKSCINVDKFNEMVEYEKKKIKSYKDDTDVFLGYKLQSKYFINKNFRDEINLAVPFNIIINKDNVTTILLEKIDLLPDRFVIKKNKLSGYTVIVDKKGSINYQGHNYKYSTGNLYEILTTILRYDYDKDPEDQNTEKMDLFIEEYVEVKEEFKFHCMHGKVVLIEHYLVSTGLNNNKWYTRDWKEVLLKGRDDPYPYIVYPNKNLAEFVNIAEKISEKVNLDYIRVDTFLSDENKLYFGELSHSPNAFHNNYSPKKMDELLYKLYTKELSIDDLEKHLSDFLIYETMIKIPMEVCKSLLHEEEEEVIVEEPVIETIVQEPLKADKDFILNLISE